MPTDQVHELVKRRVGTLRPKLLDLSRRNPLISTSFGSKSNSLIRVVDELPDVLFYKLNNGQKSRVIPLPDIDDDPKDEDLKAFRNALSNARLTDEIYLNELEAVEPDAEDYLDQARNIERALKDRVREILGMPPRPNKAQVNLVQHARNNRITPSFDLPSPAEEHADGRHTDNDIQTLLLPKDLERKLDAINTKCRTWIQETGINFLHSAFGFLEWSEPNQPKTSFAPLILASVQIEKLRTKNGSEYWLTSTGDEPEINAVLSEKLRLEFGVELPNWDGTSVEAYFAEIARITPKTLTCWKIRRQVVMGVFPSAKMAMYHDLDPAHPIISKSALVSDLLGGTNSEADSPFADEYNVDEPDIEKHVPLVVLEADSSQFSTLVDIGRGANVAVEGPPGTGKSQTIVNAIAVALANKKKVLFVAEKLAALNVVKSRLEACGLGEYLLPLQADRSSREQVITSVRDRIEMSRPQPQRDYEARLAEYREIRAELAAYIEVLTSKDQSADMTVHEILGKGIATAPEIAEIPVAVLSACTVSPAFLSRLGFEKLRGVAQTIEDAHNARLLASAAWRETELTDPEKFSVEDACDIARQASETFRELAKARIVLPDFGLDHSTRVADLGQLIATLEAHSDLPEESQDIAISLLKADMLHHASNFISSCAYYVETDTALATLLYGDITPVALEAIQKINTLCIETGVQTLDIAKLEAALQFAREALVSSREIDGLVRPLIQQKPEAGQWRFRDIAAARLVIENAGRLPLALRNPQLAEPSGLAVLTDICLTGRALQNRKMQLGQKASLSFEVTPEVLTADAAAIRSSGLFSIFSSDYRQAMRRVRSISRAVKNDKTETVNLLDELAAFRSDEQAFLLSPQTNAIFGLHFRGVETDFEPFEAMAAYFAAVNASFGSPDKRSLRNFLKLADLDELELLPALPTLPPIEMFDELRNDIAETEAKISKLHNAIATLKPLLAVFKDPCAIEPQAVLGVAKRVQDFLDLKSKLENDETAKLLLGIRFAGPHTNTNFLQSACDWAIKTMPLASRILAIETTGRLSSAVTHFKTVVNGVERSQELLNKTCDLAKISPEVFTKGREASAISEVLAVAALDGDGLFRHAKFATAMAAVRGVGVEAIVKHLFQEGKTLTGFANKLEALAARSLGRRVYASHGRVLAKYPGRTLNELRAKLAEKDRQIIKMSRDQLRYQLHRDARPLRGNGVGKRSTWTQMALIENEIAKQQRFVPVRDLTERAGAALLELKPCWMMSPLAVAQYIKKGTLQFDLCLIDEASQMPPEAAIGAMLRSKQIVVVGDTNQLPPSSFFKKMVDGGTTDDDTDNEVIEESILEMAKGTYRPSRRLRWHYRSRHSGLIKFSNRMVYSDNLVVFPSATESLSRMGVEFRPVKGLYKSGTNPIEARAVVDAALEFMRTDSRRSLGIVTLNQAQAALIAEEFEYALSNNPVAAAYVEKWRTYRDGLEYFFIKNLENVQGDERDVIFIGTVYGPETEGARVMQRFGPINGLAGKRRLNVLFSRAKEKIITFSSMNSGDVIAQEDGNQGAYMLARWLEYSATGVLETGVATEREPDSDFEIFVMDQIRAMGCEPVAQVGVAGYFVDIGVRHPNWPHGYILGVECDGASYHSAKSARDRDRLRQEVLEGLGWQLHRIWSTDWFTDSRQEAERLRGVIAERMVELKKREAEYVQKPIKPEQILNREPPATANLIIIPPKVAATRQPASGIVIGDTVRIRYLADDQKVIQVTISKARSDTVSGIVNHEAPIAQALLGAEEGDEVEILVGSYVKPAIVEQIIKSSSVM